MRSNVLFGGVDLGVEVPLFRLIDTQVGAVERKVSTLDPSRADGQYFASLKNDTREINLTYCLPSEDKAERRRALNSLVMLLSGRTPRQLRAPEIGRSRYINAVCTQLPSAARLDWTEELTIGFTAYDPYIYSDINDLDKALTAGGDTSLYVGCSGSVRPMITQVIDSALTDPTWTCSNGQMIMLQGTVAAGTLVIDCEAHQITHSANEDIMEQLSMDSLFFELDPSPAVNLAPYVITCSNDAAGRLTGKYRWL